MIHWLVQSSADLPALARGEAPEGLLGQDERRDLARLDVPKRRQDWLLGRHTAKQLLCAYFDQALGVTPPLDALQIRPRSDGAPQVLIDGRPLRLDLSISHSAGQAFCALSGRSGLCLGADLEQVAPRSSSFVEDYFTDEERDAVLTADEAQRDTLITVVWSAKEAVLKALHLGLTVDTRSLCCLPRAWPAAAPGWQPLRLHCLPGLMQKLGRTVQLSGWWTAEHGRVRTLAAVL